MFQTGEVNEDYLRWSEEGIYAYGHLTYTKGQTLESYLEEHGIPASWKYPIGVHDIFHDEMNINKYSCTYKEENGKWEHIDWRRTIDEFIDDADEDDVFVGIDYHS